MARRNTVTSCGCGALMVTGSGRCAACAKRAGSAKAASQPWHASAKYRAEAKRVRGLAESDLSVVCWLCGRREKPPCYAVTGWSADHEDAGDSRSRLLPAHAACNYARGNRTAEEFRERLNRVMADFLA